jgi:prepilin-type N-terminal cleavage/methylation domain-containing protein
MSSGTTILNCGKHLRVTWHECAWEPVIRQAGAEILRPVGGGRIKPLPLRVVLPHPARHKNRFKFMKKNSLGGRRFEAGFTLVELLTVIAIIAILAAMLLPVLSKVRLSALKTQARIQVNDIATAIEAYDSAYGRFPVSPAAQTAASAAGGDITYCGVYTNGPANASPAPIIWPNSTQVAGTCYTNNYNAEVISILMDYTNYPNSLYGNFTVNTNNQKNPQKTIFLNAKMSGWDPSQGGYPAAGVGNDLVYRDPWGNPYIITMDLNYDGQCQDAFYGLQSVSQNPPTSTSSYVQTGFNGLNNPNPPTPAGAQLNDYLFHGSVMVWSMGPYGPGTPSASSFDLGAANDAANKNHILSWQQ